MICVFSDDLEMTPDVVRSYKENTFENIELSLRNKTLLGNVRSMGISVNARVVTRAWLPWLPSK